MKHKNLLYLRTDLGTKDIQCGGSVAHTVGVLEGMKDHHINIWCASSAMHSILDKIPYICFRPLHLPRLAQLFGFKVSCLLSNLFFFFRVLSFTNFFRVDYLYQRYSMLNFVGILIARMRKAIFILEFNGSEAWVDQHWAPDKKMSLRLLIARIERWNVQSADYIIVVSEELKKIVMRYNVPAEKVLVNPNGVQTDLFDPAKYTQERVQLRAQYGVADCYVFGFIGTFSYWHGVEMIMSMIPLVIKRMPHVRFLLIGDGPLKQYCIAEVERMGVQHAVTFIGSVPYMQAPKYLSMCDAFLCPSQPNADGTDFFGSPTKLFEYMSMAKPIVASDVGQLKTILGDRYGYCVPYNDLQAFVGTACFCADTHRKSVKRYAIGTKARCQAIEQYSWQQHVLAIAEFVQ